MSYRHEKHKMLEMLLREDFFMHFLNIAVFEIFENHQ